MEICCSTCRNAWDSDKDTLELFSHHFAPSSLWVLLPSGLWAPSPACLLSPVHWSTVPAETLWRLFCKVLGCGYSECLKSSAKQSPDFSSPAGVWGPFLQGYEVRRALHSPHLITGCWLPVWYTQEEGEQKCHCTGKTVLLPVWRNNKFLNLVFSSKVFNRSILDCVWSNEELKNLITNHCVCGGCTPLELLIHNVLQTCCKSMVPRGVARARLNRNKLDHFSFFSSRSCVACFIV